MDEITAMKLIDTLASGVNPATGQRMRIPAARTIVFHPSQALRETLADADDDNR